MEKRTPSAGNRGTGDSGRRALQDDAGERKAEELDELDELDEQEELDEQDELDELDALDVLDDPVRPWAEAVLSAWAIVPDATCTAKVQGEAMDTRDDAGCGARGEDTAARGVGPPIAHGLDAAEHSANRAKVMAELRKPAAGDSDTHGTSECDDEGEGEGEDADADAGAESDVAAAAATKADQGGAGLHTGTAVALSDAEVGASRQGSATARAFPVPAPWPAAVPAPAPTCESELDEMPEDAVEPYALIGEPCIDAAWNGPKS